jgi:hypothetical protein
MEVAHIWTQEVRDDLLASLPDDTMFDDDENTVILTALNRLPLDTLVVMTAEEWDRLNTEDVPMVERSDAARAIERPLIRRSKEAEPVVLRRGRGDSALKGSLVG